MPPVLEYGSSVCDSYYDGVNDELENLQKLTAICRFVTRNYTFEEGSMTGFLTELFKMGTPPEKEEG